MKAKYSVLQTPTAQCPYLHVHGFQFLVGKTDNPCINQPFGSIGQLTYGVRNCQLVRNPGAFPLSWSPGER